MVRYEQDRERSFLVSMMNFDLVRGVAHGFVLAGVRNVMMHFAVCVC